MSLQSILINYFLKKTLMPLNIINMLKLDFRITRSPFFFFLSFYSLTRGQNYILKLRISFFLNQQFLFVEAIISIKYIYNI